MQKWIIAGIAGLAWALARQKVPGRSTKAALGGALGSAALKTGLKCPAPTLNLELNTKNRDLAIHAAYIQYGPLNPADEAYWVRLGKYWGTTAEVAKESRCANCAAFDLSPRMKKCMPGAVESPEVTLGYCWMHAFKCASNRVCYTWASGGPIETNQISANWQKE